jgi:hypothetical protein
MTFTFDELKQARERGYSDDEIWNTLASEDKEISLAKDRGYSLEEVTSIVSGQPIPEPEPSGALRQAADIPVQFAKGVGSAVRGYTDLFGADNEVSKSIAGYEDYMDSILSAESKKDSKRVAELLQKAQDGGFLDKVAAGFEAFASAPAEMTANTLGYMVPQLVFGVAGKAAQLSKAAQVGLTIGTGFAQGVGMGKGNIYQGTKDYLREQGIPEDQVETLASQAQEYGGKNLDQILVSGGLNALAASTGAEAILTRVLSKQGKEASGGIIKGILKGAGAEAPIEGVQSAQEAIAPNIALQREGFDVPTFRGAIESATTGVVAGGLIGGAAGAIEAMSPEQKALIDIEKESNRRMRDLDSDTPAAQALSTEITRLERGIDNKRMDLDALESTSPEANKARLDIAADQKKLAVLKTEAPKFGLSEPITEAERQQAELAKAIVEEPTPTVKESLTVQPTQAAPVEQVVTPPVEIPITDRIIQGEPKDKSKIYGGKAQTITFTDPQTEGRITIVDRRDGSPASVFELYVPEEFRQKGIGSALQKKAQEVFPSLQGQVSSKVAARSAYKLGRRPQGNLNATLDEVLGLIDRDSSVNMVTPAAQITPAPTIAEAAPEVVVPPKVENVSSIPTPEESKRWDDLSAYQKPIIESQETESLDLLASRVGVKRQGVSDIKLQEKIITNTHPDDIQDALVELKLSTPAPVTEQAAPAEAPAPEVAPTEQAEMPKDFEITGKKITKISTENGIESATKDYASALNKKGIKTEISYDVTTTIGFDTVTKTKKRITSNDNVSSGNIITPQGKLVILSDGSVNVFKPIPPTPAVSETITEPAAASTGIAVGNRVKLGKSPQTYTIEEEIPQSANDKKFGEQYYNVKNERTGKTQVVEKNDMKPVSSRRRKMASEPDPLPENERYGQVKLNQRIQRYFGGKIPDRVYVVDDAVDKEKKYQAAYYPDLGILIVNNAYIKKNANVGDIIAHELGHYAFGDKKFKAAFDNFYNSLSPEDKAKIDKIVEESYNEETEESQIEESKVIAFTSYTIVNPQRRSLWNAVLDALKAFANKVFGKNFQMSDPNRTALAILSTAKKRFAAGEEIIREEEAEGPRKMAARRTKIMSVEAGEEVETPDAIIARTKDLLRKRFDPTKVTEKNTTEAFRALGKLAGNRKEALAYAEELNDIGRLVDKSGAASEISMGAALFVNDLFEYSIRLAAEGDSKMLGIMMANINRLPTAMIGASDAGRTLAARAELKARFIMMGRAEQDAYTNYVAEFIYGPNPTKEQIQSIKDAYAAVDKTAPVTEQELTDELESVGGRTGTDLVGKINDEFTKATEKGKEKRKTEEQELDKEYNRIQKQADAEIEKLAKIQSDTPSFDPAAARQITNDVRAIVANDLKQKPDIGRKAPWKSMLVAKLQEAGVELAAAETLADIVWRQHEINSLSRELSSINKAIEKGPISEIVKAIKDTPLEDQQKPNWRYEVMRDYLRKAGLPLAQAERIAKLMDISLQKRFTMAQEQAFTDAISKSAPWKTGDTRSRRAFQKVLQALRAGALDPARNVLSDMAALNGWTGFTPEQYKALLKYDAILSDPKSADATKAEAHKAIQDIISKAKLPIRARDVIGQFYDAQALSGIPTMTVNIFSPAGMAVKNALTQSLNGLLTARPEQITASLTTFIDSIKSWANTVAFSFKNNVTVYSNVEYLVNDEGLLKLYKRGVDQFNKGKTPRERADGVKNMMIGMMDYVRRVLNALDYGAIASLQNQAVSKYALAAMQAKGMSSKDGAKMLNAMMEQKRIFYNDQIAIGTDKNKAAVLADEFFVSSWRQALTDAKLPAQQVMDAALNDAMSAVGRNRQSLDAFREEETNARDGGVISYPALWLLETMANAANKADNQVIKLFSRMIYGFAVVPARVFRETAWFSPYGAVRFAYDYIAKKMGKTSPYAQSLGNDLQYRQRLTETITGSIVLLGFAAAMSSSTEDEEDEKPFKIVVTGNGPLRSEDPQYYDSWTKKHKANTVSVYFGKTKFTINTMRGFEAFAWPAMMLGAVDDWQIRRKQKRETNTPMQMGDAAIIGGFVLSASLRRGPYSFAAKPLFEAYGDRGVESLAKSLAFPAKTLVPVLGASLARNLSDFLNEPVDRKTLEGALWSNIPFIGPAVSPKSLNAFGEPALANEAADKIFKLGVPITFNIPTDRDSVNLHELVLKQGGGPSIPTRNQLAQRLDRQPTNKEYEMFVKEYGTIISTKMKNGFNRLSDMTPEKYSKVVERIGNNARDAAERKVRLAAKKP